MKTLSVPLYGTVAAVVGRWLVTVPHPLAELAGYTLLGGYLLLVALALGKWAAGRSLDAEPRPVQAAAAGALGWFILALLTLLLGFAGLLSAAAGWLLVLAVGIPALALRGRWLVELAAALRREFTPRPLPERLARAAVLIFLGLAFLALPAPPLFYDALTYHLAVPQAYLTAGRIIDLPHNFYSAFPQGVDMLFLLGLLLGGETTAHFIGFGFGLLAGAALWALARHRLGLSPTVSWLALLITAATPAINDYLAQADADIAPILYLALAVWFLTAPGGARGRWAWLGIATGLAMGVKYTLWFALPLHCLLVLLWARPIGTAIRAALLVAAVALLVAAPWPAKNLALTGNPVYPFAGQWLPVRNLDPALQAAYHRQGFDLFGTEKSITGWFIRPWEMTMADEQFGKDTVATIGPLFLIFVPFGFLGKLPHRARLVLYLLAWYTWWSATSQQTRHILFALALAALIAAHGARQLWRPGLLRVLVAGLLLVGLVHQFGWTVMKREHFYRSYEYLAGSFDRSGYLARRYLGWPAVEQVNCLPADSRTLFVGHEFGAYVVRPATVAPSYNRDPLEQLLLDGKNAAACAAALRAAGYTHVLWSEPGLAFKRGFGHYRLDPAQEQELASFRKQFLIQLFARDDVYFYVLAGGTAGGTNP